MPTLEGLTKSLKELGDSVTTHNESLSKLTRKIVGAFIAEDSPESPTEIKSLASQLRGPEGSIDNLRGNKSTVHGKAPDEYVIDDEPWAETAVNATATLGIPL